MAYVITSPCEGEMSGDCVEVCPVDCIKKGKNMFFIDPEICIDCGACGEVCPVNAIFYEADVPDVERVYIDKSYAFFASNR